MGIDLSKMGAQLKSLWTKLSLAKKIALAGGLIAVLGVVGFLSTQKPEEKWAVLFNGLGPEDAMKVIEQIKAQQTPHRLANAGTAIEVPEDKVHELRIALAASGLPRGGGIGFEVFDKQAFGTTTFVEQMNYRRALSGELARTIGAIDAVENARVHLALKERSIYKKDEEPASASVVLTLRPGRELSPAQVKGIVHLLASSVEGLRRDQITVVDASGTMLWSDDTVSSESDAQRNLERTLAKRITEITERIVGPDNSVVVVTAELDSAMRETTEELYDRDKVAVRSETKSEELVSQGEKKVEGVAGARGNLPGAPDPTLAAKTGPESKRVSETRNFEVNRVLNRIVGPKWKLRRIHVAILVNGALSGPGLKTATASVADGIVVHNTDLDGLALLAKEAAGLDLERGDRIEVRSMPFAAPLTAMAENKALKDEAAAPILPDEKLLAVAGAGALGLLLLAVLAVVLIRRRRKAKQMRLQKELEEKEKAEKAALELPVLPMAASEMEKVLNGGKEAEETVPELSPRERIIEAARKDSQRAARILAAWLAEGAAVEAKKPRGSVQT